MKLSEFNSLLNAHPDAELRFVLPGGESVAVHSHVTEIGRVEKLFIDCGGKPHRTVTCQIQVWEYLDTDHRLTPGVLARIFDKAAPIFGGEDVPMEVEFEQGVISQYPVKSSVFEDGKLAFELETKHTACLAMDRCGLAPGEESAEGSGCCGGDDAEEEEAEATSCCSSKSGCC
ncbi:MAG: DUF6428 family protein [Candidatus Methylacidiphilales bacterium]|nr:DUF6428 family protein [Candidatus Methylacidiphilales bacterium]